MFFIITVFHFSTTEGISFFCDICRNLSGLLSIFYSKTGLNQKGERIIMGNSQKEEDTHGRTKDAEFSFCKKYFSGM